MKEFCFGGRSPLVCSVLRYMIFKWAASTSPAHNHMSQEGQSILDQLLPIRSPLHISRNKIIQLSFPVLLEGAAAPGSLPICAQSSLSRQTTQQNFAPGFILNGQDSWAKVRLKVRDQA